MDTQRKRQLARQMSGLAVMTVPETAEMLKTSQWTIYKLLRERQLGSIQVGARRLIPLADFHAFIEAKRQPVEHGDCHGT